MGKSNSLGVWGERQAAFFLEKRGFHVVEHNYHSRYGELDLIAENDRFLVFAEVKLRKSSRYGTPAEAVTPQKQEKLRLTALQYLQEHPTDRQPRFDVVEIYAPCGAEPDQARIHIIENAF